ncbi:MAG: Crp/Fnr family transcriptional regulator [Polyangiaceae bacterium]|nr:Crp/Fnr family transcriptional regulator [Polyangiaceae bacterium]MCE7891185.1 Crp/Fnr family transcriptional regulator [Sorangiineae bacterium PRO1]MCL4754181.1 Crp/Fnr family transcriptional regulator [Myxococcales bacterium]
MGVREFIERAKALSGAEPQLLDRMAAAASTRTLARGEVLWRAGDLAKSLTVIKSGLIKVVRPAARGRASICGIFGPPDTVGDLAVLRQIAYPADAIVATESATVISIPGSLLTDPSAQSTPLAMSMACAMHTKLTALHDKVEVLSAGSVESRLATLLVKLYDRFGDDFDDGSHSIPVALSRRELAELVATSFETAIRVMTRWEREGVLVTTPHGFTVHDMNGLKAAAGGESGEALLTLSR